MISLRRYFQSSFLLLTICPLLLLGALLCWFVFHIQLDGDQRFLEQRARHAAEEIREFFDYQREEVLDITRFHNFLQLNHQQQREALLEALRHQPLLQEIALFDGQGSLLHRVSTLEVFSALANREWSRDEDFGPVLESAQVHYSSVRIDPDSLQPMMRMAIPYKTPGASQVSAIFDVKLRLQILQELIQGFGAPGAGSSIYISDRNHRIISHSNPSYVLAEKSFLPLPELLQKGLDGRLAIIKTAQVKLGNQRFNVIVEQNALVALTPAWRATAFSALMLLLSLASVSLFNRNTRLQIVEPVEALTRTAQAISDGDLSRQARVSGHHEIRRMIATVNSMTGRLFSSLNCLEEEVKERRRVELQLRRTQESLAFHLQHTPVGAIVWNAEGKVTEWNPAAEKIFGFRKAEVLNQSAFDLIVPNCDEAELKGIFQALLNRRSGHVNTNKNITKYGQTIICEWHNTPLVNDLGEVYGIASLVIDLSERIRLEEMMIQSEKMLSLGNMVAGIAHELNNPLAAILLNIQMLENRLLKESPTNREAAAEQQVALEAVQAYAQQRKLPTFVGAIHEAGERAARIITSMLSLSRREGGERRFCDLAQMIDQVLELLASDYNFEKNFDFKQIEIVRQFQPDLPAVLCEPSQLQQVLVNIINNAAQAMREAKTPAPRISIGLQADELTLQLSIRDNGPGMAEAVRSRIFEPFFTTKRVGTGTGLGLSICYHIITENHQGSMQVESEPGAGTCFIIGLPLRAPA